MDPIFGIGILDKGLGQLKFLPRKNLGGFTLLELLVSIGIFVIITTAVVLNFRVGERSDELRLATERLVSGLRGLSTMSQTGQRTQVCAGEDSNPRVPKGGYGFHIAATGTIAFFANCEKNFAFDSNSQEISDIRFDLPVSVVIQSGASELTIVFEPPVPTVHMNDCNKECPAEAIITLVHTKTGQTKQVIIRRVSGRIEVKSI